MTATQELQFRIEQLENKRKSLETAILKDVKVVADTIKNPAPYIKSTVAELASEKSFFVDLVTVVLQFLTSYVAGKVGQNFAKSGFFSELFRNLNAQEGDKSSFVMNLLKKIFAMKGKSGTGDRDADGSAS